MSLAPPRGRSAAFGERLRRLDALGTAGPAGEPLALARAVLEHQRARAGDPTVTAAAALAASGADERRARGRYPLLHTHAATDAIVSEIGRAVAALAGQSPSVVPEALAIGGREILARPSEEQRELVESWLDDPSLLDPPLALWVAVAAGPALELAADAVATPSSEEWQGPACPLCGGPPQVSVIHEGTGEFLGGAPRSLVCSRCAGWWRFARATCPACGETDPRDLVPYVPEQTPWVRVDGCRTCRSYAKTFDLREEGARDVVPLVDDVASLTLDLWAAQQGMSRPVRSFAGV